VFGGAFSATINGVDILECVSKQPAMGMGVGRQIRGALTTIAQQNYNLLAVDAAHARLYVKQANTVLVFDDATTVTGNVAPSRTFTSQALGAARGIAYDAQRDLLYVAADFTNIAVFANASTASGAVNPVRTIAVPNSGSINALALDVAGDRLFVDNQGTVYVYDNASTLNGSIAPNRTFGITNVSSYGLALDTTNNTLYVSSRNDNKIYAITNASAASGLQVAARIISPNVPSQPMGLSLAGGKLAHFNDSATSVQIWNDVNTLNGTVAPSQNLQFPVLTSGGSVVYVP
jgi:hypothetical protein